MRDVRARAQGRGVPRVGAGAGDAVLAVADQFQLRGDEGGDPLVGGVAGGGEGGVNAFGPARQRLPDHLGQQFVAVGEVLVDAVAGQAGAPGHCRERHVGGVALDEEVTRRVEQRGTLPGAVVGNRRGLDLRHPASLGTAGPWPRGGQMGPHLATWRRHPLSWRHSVPDFSPTKETRVRRPAGTESGSRPVRADGSVVVLIAALVGIVSGFTTGLGDDTVSALRRLPATHIAFAAGTDSDRFARSLVDERTLAGWAGEKGVTATPLGVAITRGTTARGVEVDLAAFGVVPGAFTDPGAGTGRPLDAAVPDGIVISRGLVKDGVRVGDILTVDQLGSGSRSSAPPAVRRTGTSPSRTSPRTPGAGSVSPYPGRPRRAPLRRTRIRPAQQPRTRTPCHAGSAQ